MKLVLGRKQNLFPDGEAKWWDVIDHITEYVSMEECEEWEAKTLQRIHAVTDGKKAGYSWSGGKDSIVLSKICRKAGITKAQCLITDLEYPAWEAWLREHLPPDCKAVDVKIGLEYLRDHPEMIFASGAAKQKWNRIVQRNHFLRFIREEQLDVLCLGHRTIDGNFCGKDGIVQRKNGPILFSPLFDWPHEVLFAYMHYNGLELPFIYEWYRGFYEGTHWWPYRYADSVEQGYREVYDIDPSVVTGAAKLLPSAKAFLEGVGA